jgi:hypothetical protein
LDALKRDRPQFINTFIKLNFNVPGMFYQKQTNKPWKLVWRELAKLYNDDNIKNVREDKTNRNQICSLFILETSSLFTS